MKEKPNFSKDIEKRPECPFLSKGVICNSCGGPYNVDAGCQRRGNKVYGGYCDYCGHTVGKLVK